MRTGTCAAAPGAWRLVGRASFAPCSPLIMALIGRARLRQPLGGLPAGAGPRVGGGRGPVDGWYAPAATYGRPLSPRGRVKLGTDGQGQVGIGGEPTLNSLGEVRVLRLLRPGVCG